MEQSKTQTFEQCQVRFPTINIVYNFNTFSVCSAGGDTWSHRDKKLEAKKQQRTAQMSYSNNDKQPICGLLMNVVHRIVIMILRQVILIVKFIYHMCFHRTNTTNAIQEYTVWFYETYLTILFRKCEERIVNYSCGFFFPETFYPNRFVFHGFRVPINLFGMFTLVFVLAMASFPVITFLSIAFVLFILFQAIANQGIVIYYYYFSNNKNSG